MKQQQDGIIFIYGHNGDRINILIQKMTNPNILSSSLINFMRVRCEIVGLHISCVVHLGKYRLTITPEVYSTTFPTRPGFKST